MNRAKYKYYKYCEWIIRTSGSGKNRKVEISSIDQPTGWFKYNGVQYEDYFRNKITKAEAILELL